MARFRSPTVQLAWGALEGLTPVEVKDYTGTFGNELDYYIYELGRLHDLVNIELPKAFGKQQQFKDWLATFDAEVPHLKFIRNALTHMDDTDRLDRFATFGAAVDLVPGGRVVYFVDPDSYHHDVALAPLAAIRNYLQDELAQSRKANPVLPLDQQIAERKHAHDD